MASPRLETGMRTFFADFLELDTLGVTTKDPTIYPKYNEEVASASREETLRTVVDLTLTKNGDFRDILTTRKTFINRPLAWTYGVPYNLNGEWMPYEFGEADGRSGIVTQASMLSMFSHPGRGSPTRRGVAFLDIFMCEPTPAPPGNVDFSIVNDTTNPNLRTVRDRLNAHATTPACSSCHTHSDPMGTGPGTVRQYRRAPAQGRWPGHRCFRRHRQQALSPTARAWASICTQSQSARLFRAQIVRLWRGRQQRGLGEKDGSALSWTALPPAAIAFPRC
jgi:hypothetical protein